MMTVTERQRPTPAEPTPIEEPTPINDEDATATDRVTWVRARLDALNMAIDRLTLIKSEQPITDADAARIDRELPRLEEKRDALAVTLEEEKTKKATEDIDNVLKGVEDIDTDV